MNPEEALETLLQIVAPEQLLAVLEVLMQSSPAAIPQIYEALQGGLGGEQPQEGEVPQEQPM